MYPEYHPEHALARRGRHYRLSSASGQFHILLLPGGMTVSWKRNRGQPGSVVSRAVSGASVGLFRLMYHTPGSCHETKSFTARLSATTGWPRNVAVGLGQVQLGKALVADRQARGTGSPRSRSNRYTDQLSQRFSTQAVRKPGRSVLGSWPGRPGLGRPLARRGSCPTVCRVSPSGE